MQTPIKLDVYVDRVHTQIAAAARRAVQQWNRSKGAYLELPAYLWYQPGCIGFYVGPAALNMQWVQVSSTRIRISMTDAELEQHIRNHAIHLPILMGQGDAHLRTLQHNNSSHETTAEHAVRERRSQLCDVMHDVP